MAEITINMTIPTEKAEEAVAGFLAICPNITDDPQQWSGDELSDQEWMEARTCMWLNNRINDGRRHNHHIDYPDPGDETFAE